MNCLTFGLFLVVNPAFFLKMDVTTLLSPGLENSFLGLEKKKKRHNAIFAQKPPGQTKIARGTSKSLLQKQGTYSEISILQ